MIDLKKFPKIGVRVPNTIRNSVKRLAIDMGEENIDLDGDELTMEAIFAVATLELMGMSKEAKVKVFARRIPELIAMFEREMPALSPTPDVETPTSSRANPRKRRGAG